MHEAFKLAPHEWALLRTLLDEAMAIAPADREAWVDRLDEALYATLKPRLRSLLVHARDAAATPDGTVARLLDTLPKVETGQFAALQENAVAPPERVGPYRLIRELGSGGMASVWLAERTDMLQGRQVALKLPHGSWKRAGLAERLAREREILATLEHPNIARLYDAGVGEDGQPYLALEYVQGERIDAWCEHKALGVRERLQLFLQVARAVAYAHAQLVVHRDLKPSNILVNDAGDVKLLDFGIAKLLDQGVAQETELTQQAGRALTPDYAAPEQILGKPIGTAADVYALGVVLFELLTGQRPYRLKRDTRAALEEAILQADVQRPSDVAPETRRKALRGDLDTVVLKAIKKETSGRYGTVAALAEDVERHLEHRPVLARPDSAGYRLRTAIRRHRLPAAAGAAVMASLLGGTGVALWQAQVARQQRDAAVAERERADRQASSAQLARRIAEGQASMSDFLLTDAAQKVPHAEAVAQIELAVTMVRKQYRDDPAVRADLLADAGNRMRWIGEAGRARELWGEAEALMRKGGAHAGVARVLCMRARERALAGEIEPARRLVAEGREALRRITDPELVPGAGCLLDEAVVERRAGNPLRALALGEEALTLERAAGRNETDLVATLLHETARSQFELDKFAAAVSSARASLAVRERIGRDLGNNLRATWFLLAMARREGGQTAQALRDFTGDGRFNPQGADQSVNRRLHHALGLLVHGHADESLRTLQALQASLSASDLKSEGPYVALHAARAQLALGQIAEAGVSLQSVAHYFEPLAAERRFTAYRYLVARAEWARRGGHLREAALFLDQARLTLDAESQPEDPPSREWSTRALHRAVAELALAQRHLPQAMDAAQLALSLSQRTAIDRGASVYVGEDLLLRASIRRALGDEVGFRSDAEAARAHFLTAGGPGHPLALTLERLAHSTATPKP